MIAAIVRASLFVKLALAGLLLGIGFVGYSAVSAPAERASLQRLESTLASATRVTRTSRRSGSTTSYFQLTLRPGPAGAEEIRLTVPVAEASESDIRAVMGKRVRAEYRSADDVYALSAGGMQIVRFEQVVERRRSGYRQYKVDGVAIILGSALVLLVAGGLTWRRLGRQAVA
jgi:hypothetical protein